MEKVFFFRSQVESFSVISLKFYVAELYYGSNQNNRILEPIQTISHLTHGFASIGFYYPPFSHLI
jgi:hypothetical protein